VSIEDSLRDSLHLRAAAAEPTEEMWARISSRTSSPPMKGRRVAVTTVALLTGTAAVALVVIAFGTSTPRTTPVPRPAEGPPPMDARIGHTIDVGATAYSVAAESGSTWVVTYDFDRSSGRVVHLDASTGRVLGRIPLDGFVYNISAASGSVWVAAEGSDGRPALVRIDGQSDRITGTVPGVTGPIAVDASGVWAIEGTNVVRIRPDPLEIDARIPLSAVPLDISAGGGSVWVLGRTVDDSAVSSGPLTQIDSATATLVRKVEFASTGLWLASAEDGVWVASDDGVAFVANSGGPPQVAGDVYNFRPFLVADKRVWFISGPHDPGLPEGGVCGLNITTRRVDVCAEPASIVDFAGAHDALALDPVSQTLWVSQYESSLVTGIQLSPASRDTTP
jgi:hypothetical protein